MRGKLFALLLTGLLTAGPAQAAPSTEVNDALAKFQSGDPQGALALLTQAIASGGLDDIGAAVAHYDRGVVYASLGERQSAQADFDAAIALRPHYSEAYSARAQIRLDGHDPDGALADLTALLAFDPTFPDLHYHLARVYEAKGYPDKAMSEYDAAIAAAPSAHAYEGRGVLNLRAGRQARAIDDLDAAIHLKPDLATAYVDRGQAHLMARNYDAAMADFDAALRLKPDDATAKIGRATAAGKAGRPDTGELEAAIAADPEAAAALYRTRGDAELSRQNYDAAIADYDRALAHAPNDAVALINRGAARHGLGQYDDAIADYRAALKIKTRDPMIYNNLGNAYAAQGKLDKAIAAYDKALAIDPGYVPAKRNRAGAIKARTTGRTIRATPP